MKKLFAMALVAAMAAMMVSCGEKDNDTPDTPAGGVSLAGTAWHHDDNYWLSEFSFKDDKNVYHHEVYHDDNETHNIWGTYTYDGTNGTMNFNYSGDPYTLTFTINGDKMTAHVVGEGDYEYTKMTYVDPGDVPGGNPGGDDPTSGPASLDNIKYKYETGTYGESGYLLVSILFRASHTDNSRGSATVHHDYYNDGDVAMDSYTGSYSYNSANGTGSITLKDVETEETVDTATFSINGSTLTLTMLGQTYTLTKEE